MSGRLITPVPVFFLKEKRVAEDEKPGQHHQLNGHELGQTPGDSEGQGGLVCYSPWARKELDTTTEPQ